MSTGTGGEYWQAKALPSVFKHGLLKSYMPQFGGMTGSKAKALTYLDGYAGEGRYESGEPGSAEIVLKVAHYHLQRDLRWTVFLSERKPESVARLNQVAGDYRAQGVDVRVHPFDVGTVFDEVLTAAEGLPLFLFLDPCGLGMPFEQLVGVLAGRPQKKRGSARAWPPTEFLLNFSMMAVYRLGGNARSPKGLEQSNQRMDAVCGGSWWREYFTGDDYERDGPELVAAEYARRLSEATGMLVESVPVRKRPTHKPIYHLVFGTHSQYGLWVFGDAVARARDGWWNALEEQEQDEDPGALFPIAQLIRPDPKAVEAAAVPVIAENLGQLLTRYREFRVLDHTREVFGPYYAQVTESTVRKAIKHLHGLGQTSSDGRGERPRELIVRR